MSLLLESMDLSQEAVLIAFAAVGLCLFVVYEWMRKGKAAGMFPHPSGNLSDNTVKTDAEWKTPSPKPLFDFDLDAKKAELYRPCRHGPNHVTMGIRKMDWNNWIEMDSNFLWYHDLKVSELEKDIDAHVQYVDNTVTRDACFEVLEELTAYLTVRYPKIFQLGNGILRNTLTKEEFNYPASMYHPQSQTQLTTRYSQGSDGNSCQIGPGRSHHHGRRRWQVSRLRLLLD